MVSKRFIVFSDMRKVLILILAAGILIRFLLEFIFPSFNVDEIALGRNIYERSYFELLFPLDREQSSPPLYLLLQKFIISISPFVFWISIKILSFTSSATSLYLVYRYTKRFDLFVAALILVMFAFNPFMIYNSLTVKQYTIDLLGILILVNFHKNPYFQRYIAIYFVIWSLISNAGLFGCAGYLLFLFSNEKKYSFSGLLAFIRSHLLIILAPLPYLLYFLWFMRQKGAAALKAYMQMYWSDSFLPLDGRIFKYLGFLTHRFWKFLFNGYEFLGILMMIVAAIGLYRHFAKKEFFFRTEITLILWIALIHILLNVVHLYPLSERLFFYMSPLLVFPYGAAVYWLTSNFKWRKILISALILGTICSYQSYFPHSENDVVSLHKKLEKINPEKENYYGSEDAIKQIRNFNDFTRNYFSTKKMILYPVDSTLSKSEFLITRVHHKYGPQRKTAPESPQINILLQLHKIELFSKVNGYNIYKITK